MAGLGRAIRYLGHYRKMTLAAYAALLISVGAQLMVPQLVQRILDAITRGVTAAQLAQVPTAFQPKALQALGWTPEQFALYSTGAETALITAGLLIVAFAVMRAFFSFSQNYMGSASPRAWRSTSATSCSPRSSACRSATTIATRPASS